MSEAKKKSRSYEEIFDEYFKEIKHQEQLHAKLGENNKKLDDLKGK